MLINFIGAPCSGKTTTAARLYADLKDQGYPAEFVPEQARRYLARTKLLRLTDNDQCDIMAQQYVEESLFSASKELVICDSSVLNTLLYMSPQIRDLPGVQGIVEWTKTAYGVVFLCEPVQPRLVQPDPYRVHTWEESLAYSQKVRDILSQHAPWIKYVVLTGDSKHRSQEALRAVFEKMYHADL